MEINTYQGAQVIPHLLTSNAWCKRQLKNYPYFYMPAESQIINPSDIMYVNEPDALLVIAQDKNQVLAVSAGIPLNSPYLTSYYFSPEIILQFRMAGHDPANIWYMGYFLVSDDYRDDANFIKAIYQKFLDHAAKLNCRQMSYVNVLTKPEKLSRKPKNYRYMEPWDDVITGFVQTSVSTQATWPTLQPDGLVKDETHEIRFYVSE